MLKQEKYLRNKKNVVINKQKNNSKKIKYNKRSYL